MTVADIATELDITPLSGTIGASIRGVDLKQQLAPETVAAIRAALLTYKVIFFPKQFLEPAQHVAFGRYFGELTPAHPVIPGIKGYPEIFEIDYARTGGKRDDYEGLDWHTDVTFVERPPLGSILNAIVMPPAGGDTMWSDQRAAYESLSQPMRDFLDPLTAMHDGRPSFGALLKARKEGEWEGDKVLSLDPTAHPVVRRHPETGAKSLFVNKGFTSYIKGLRRDESAALLSFLCAHATKPQHTVRYHWQTGDLAFWDNRVTQHCVVGDFAGQARVIQRITLRGDKPVA